MSLVRLSPSGGRRGIGAGAVAAVAGLAALVSVAAAGRAWAAEGGEFVDVPEGHWAYEAISRLAAAGVAEGYPDGTFGGSRALTRYEAAVMASRMFDRLRAALQEEVRISSPRIVERVIVEKQPQVVERVEVERPFEVTDEIRAAIEAVVAGRVDAILSHRERGLASRLEALESHVRGLDATLQETHETLRVSAGTAEQLRMRVAGAEQRLDGMLAAAQEDASSLAVLAGYASDWRSERLAGSGVSAGLRVFLPGRWADGFVGWTAGGRAGEEPETAMAAHLEWRGGPLLDASMALGSRLEMTGSSRIRVAVRQFVAWRRSLVPAVEVLVRAGVGECRPGPSGARPISPLVEIPGPGPFVSAALAWQPGFVPASLAGTVERAWPAAGESGRSAQTRWSVEARVPLGWTGKGSAARLRLDWDGAGGVQARWLLELQAIRWPGEGARAMSGSVS
ncbi:MAG: S-layer homology domain-containing protein [Limnochordaceae bacterium]|nr:S-layer homology domain-containing protein [Limnochordaceae bacterium]